MKIAVCSDNGEVFQHFGHTPEFLVCEVVDGKVVASEIVSSGGIGHGALAGLLGENKIDLLICGGIGGGGTGSFRQYACRTDRRRAFARNGKRCSRQDRHTVHRAVASAHPRAESCQPLACRRSPSVFMHFLQRLLPHPRSRLHLCCPPLTFARCWPTPPPARRRAIAQPNAKSLPRRLVAGLRGEGAAQPSNGPAHRVPYIKFRPERAAVPLDVLLRTPVATAYGGSSLRSSGDINGRFPASFLRPL
ncbi:MAG: hypothetical protein J6P13_04940 [Kiritimatiellae bacterium]|nr:hypothetical protein [Kiritimatiellia bacterium]